MQNLAAVIFENNALLKEMLSYELSGKSVISWITDGLSKSEACSGGVGIFCESSVKKDIEEMVNGAFEVFDKASVFSFIESSNAENVLFIKGIYPFLNAKAIDDSFNFHITGLNSATILDNNLFWLQRKYIKEDVSRLTAETIQNKEKVERFVAEAHQIISVKNSGDLFKYNGIVRNEIINRLVKKGVFIGCPDGITVSPDADIEAGSTIFENTVIKGKSVIKKGAKIGPSSHVKNSFIGENSAILASYVLDSEIKEDVTIGPFSQIRPDCVVEKGVHIGDFVELKNSKIGEKTSVSHLTYVGDSDVGRGVNFGCGVVTVNYDGEKKNRTTVGDYAFIGCNTNLVAPVKVGDCAYTAAGSTITKDVPDGALAISRCYQTNKENWAEEKLRKYVEKKSK